MTVLLSSTPVLFHIPCDLEAELCRLGILTEFGDDYKSADECLDGIVQNDDGSVSMHIHTARKAISGLDTLLDSNHDMHGKGAETTKAIRDLSLRLALAIFSCDTTFGIDQMNALKRRNEARRWRVIPYIRNMLRSVV